jgi:hypothetical protein
MDQDLLKVNWGIPTKKLVWPFRGQLEQNFVVFYDRAEKPRHERTNQLGNEMNTGSPRKRPREETEQDQSLKNPKNK